MPEDTAIVVEEESLFDGGNPITEPPSFLNLPTQEPNENYEIFTIPYRGVSCHTTEGYSRNCLNPYVSSTLTAEVKPLFNEKINKKL